MKKEAQEFIDSCLKSIDVVHNVRYQSDQGGQIVTPGGEGQAPKSFTWSVQGNKVCGSNDPVM